jgi:NADH:ubiquinone oxidoreductase subunit F (NADH-binding)/Pyruvate/2-oxoacid:ferredoxin oxidoreductase delta subunit
MENINPDIISFCIKNLLVDEPEESPKVLEEKISVLQRNNISKPIVYVGVNSSSIVAGALEVIKAINEYRENNSLEFNIIEVGSTGLCSLEPIIDVQLPGKTRIAFQKVTAEIIPHLLDGAFNNYLPEENVLAQYRNALHQPWSNVPFFDELSFFATQHRILLSNCGIINSLSIIDAFAFGRYKSFAKVLRNFTHSDVCNVIIDSELRGRGGGGFPTGTKWKVALEAPADQKYFICNADESDPGTFMDRLLIESDPHLIIEGIAISAYAVGARKAFVYTRNRYELTVNRLENAINQAYEVGLLGDNILDSGYSLDISIKKGPGAYVCGEETALIQSIEGKRGMPTLKPPYPAIRGLNGKPTVVNNIETIANVPFIIEKGAEWFKLIGSAKSKGTKLFSVSGKVNNTCLIEVPLGVPIARIVEIAGGVKKGKNLKAVHIGGPSGGSTTVNSMNTPIDYETLKDIGLSMGSGGIIVFDDSVCVVDMVKYFMNFIQHESCGKCIPCREGSQRMVEILSNITRRPITDEKHNTLERFKGVIHLESLADVMRDTSLCGLGQTAPNPVLSALKNFREEFEEHIFDRYCRANVCRNLRTYYIDIEKCTGCGVCEKKCPTNAIIGSHRSPYFVVEEKCIGCGICDDVCKFSAVFYK